MATLNFPTSPSVNDTYSFNGKTWVWNGQGWQLQNQGAINGIVIGNVTPAAGTFTTLSASGNVISGNVLTSGLSISGNVIGNLLPSANITYDLGSTSQRWKDLYLSNSTIYLGNAQISANATSIIMTNPAGGQTVLAGGSGSSSITGAVVSATGNITGGNVLTAGTVSAAGNIAGNYFIGNGSLLTGVSGGGTVTFGNTAPLTPNVGDVWIVGNTAVQLIYFNDGAGSQWAEMEAFETYSGSNVTNSPSGSLNQLQYNNGSGGFAASSNLTFNGTVLSLVGNLYGTGTVSVSGNVTSGNLNTVGLSVTGNVLSTLNSTSNITTTANIAGGNISATTGLTTGTLTLTGNTISSSDSIITIDPATAGSGGGVIIQGNLSVTGNVTYINSNNVTTNDLTINMANNAATAAAANGGGIEVGPAGSPYATLTYASTANIWIMSNGACVSGIMSATANVTGGNILTAGLMSSTGNATHGNILTGGLVSATANVTGGNILTAGLLSVTGNILGASKLLIGTGASTLTNPVAVFQGSGATYTQVATFNSTGTGSADLVAYGNNGDDTNSWADIGFTGNTFSDAAYTVTAAGDGYFFTQGNASFGGNMVIATGNVGTTKDIVFATGGFLTANIKARLVNSTGAFSVVGNVIGAGHVGTIYTNSVINTGANLTGNIGSSTGYFNTVFAQATSAQYADLAEFYESDLEYEPGTVLMFGGDKEITLADADTTAIAGVVSTNPAHSMNASCPGLALPIALQGRVPCKVIGPTRKGDLMVSAGNGYAKATKTPQIGQVIGKALVDLGNEIKVIEIAVGRL